MLVCGLVSIVFSVGCSDGGSAPAPAATPTVATSPSTSNTLRLEGSLATDSSREVVGSGQGCSYGPPLKFETNAMTLATAGVWAHPAKVSIARNTTSGAGNTINAISGRVTVSRADAANSLFSGAVEARFADGTHVTGGWLCRTIA